MLRVCELIGKRVMVGNNVFYVMNKIKCKFNVNLVKKCFYIFEEDKWIILCVFILVMKNINKKGIFVVIKEVCVNGYFVK